MSSLPFRVCSRCFLIGVLLPLVTCDMHKRTRGRGNGEVQCARNGVSIHTAGKQLRNKLRQWSHRGEMSWLSHCPCPQLSRPGLLSEVKKTQMLMRRQVSIPESFTPKQGFESDGTFSNHNLLGNQSGKLSREGWITFPSSIFVTNLALLVLTQPK